MAFPFVGKLRMRQDKAQLLPHFNLHILGHLAPTKNLKANVKKVKINSHISLFVLGISK